MMTVIEIATFGDVEKMSEPRKNVTCMEHLSSDNGARFETVLLGVGLIGCNLHFLFSIACFFEHLIR
jgi:hypothetical protein